MPNPTRSAQATTPRWTRWPAAIAAFMLAFSNVATWSLGRSAVETAWADIPQMVNYQGRLTASDGNAVQGSYTMTFRLYDAETGGSELWKEDQAVSLTESDDGIFNVILGSVTAMSSISFNAPMWLSVQISGDSEMTPRQRLTATGYAINADKLDSLDSTSFLRTDVDTATSGKLTITRSGAAFLIKPTTNPAADTKLADIQNASGTTLFSVDIEGDAAVTGNLAVTGTISGSTSTAGSSSTTWTIDNDNTSGTEPASGAGLVVEGGSGDVSLLWDATNDEMDLSSTINVTGNAVVSAQGDLRLGDSDSSNYVAFQAPATVSSNVLWTLPGADGSSNQVLTTNGSGTLAWQTTTDIAGTGDITAIGNITSGAAFTATSGADGTTLYFEGATSDGNEVALTSADPGSDITVTLPATTGTVVTTGDSGTVTSTMIADATIAAADLATDSVTAAKIAADAVGTSEIATDGVDSAEIAANAVGTSEIATDGVGSAEIAADAVGTSEIATDGVGSAELAATDVTAGSYGSSTQVPAITVDADGRLTAAANTTITLTGSNISNDSLDFAQLDDTLDLDANLTLNQTTYLWDQSFTGTTTTGLTYTGGSLTTGKLLSLSATNTPTTDAAINPLAISLTNAQGTTANTNSFTGLALDYAHNTTAATATETGMRIRLSQNDSASTDTTIASLLRLENLDTSTGNSLTVADALLIQATTDGLITDALDVSDAEITNALNIGANTITGTTGAIDLSYFDVSATGGVTTGGAGQDGSFAIYSEQGDTDYSLTFSPNATMTQNVTLTLPADDGSASQVLTTDGSGALSWATANGISGVGDITKVGSCTSGDCLVDGTNNTLTFEGSTDDGFEVTLQAADAVADATVTIPATTGTVVTTGDTGTVTSAMIATDTIVAGDIATNGVDAAEIAADAVGTSEIATDGVGAAEIAADAVGTSEIATDGVGAAEIAADAVGTSEIATDGVAAAEIAADAVGTSEIATDGVGAAEIVAGAVGTSEVSDDSLDFADLDDTLDVDAATEINLGSANLTIDTDSTGDFVIEDGDSGLHIFADSGYVGLGTTSPATRLDVTGLTVNTDADNTIGAANFTMSLTKDDTNTRTFSGLTVKPTFNTGGSNTTTTFNILTIDSTNTATTGLTANLIKASYGGSQVFSVSSAGAIQTGAAGQDGSLTFYSEQGATDYTLALQPHATMTQNVTLTLPADDGSANQVLTTNGSGALTWQTTTDIAGTGDITAIGDITSGAAFTATTGADGTTLYFEGATSDGNEVALTSADPGSDITVTLPATTGTVITTGDSGTVTSTIIAADTIVAGDIAADGVGSSEIAADAVGTSEIATDGVGAAEIVADAVGSSEIAADAVGTSEIATDGVAAAEIAADAVGTSEIATDGVGAAEIAAGAVGTSEVSDDSLDFADLDDTLDLDAATTLNLGAADFTINTDSTGDFVIADGGSGLHIFNDSGYVGVGTTSPATRLDVTGLTVSTDANNTIGAANFTMSLTKNDSNTRAFSGLKIKPTLNTGGSNTNTTLNILSIDSTNTATTGVTTNLINAAYGGSDVFTVNSAGTITTESVAAAAIAAGAVGASELASTAVAAGDYGSATQVPTYTVDADGRLTAAANVTIAVGASGITNDSLDFAQFADNMSIDATTTIDMNGADLVLDDMSSSDLLQLQNAQAGADTATFYVNNTSTANAADLVITPSDGGVVIDTTGSDELSSVTVTDARDSLAVATNSGTSGDADGVIKLGKQDGSWEYIQYDASARSGSGQFVVSNSMKVLGSSPATIEFDDGTGTTKTLTYDSTADEAFTLNSELSVVDLTIEGSSPAGITFGDGSNKQTFSFDPNAGGEFTFSGGVFTQQFRNLIRNGSFEAFSTIENFASSTASCPAGGCGGAGNFYQGGWQNFAPDEWLWKAGKIFQRAPGIYTPGTTVTATHLQQDYLHGKSALTLEDDNLAATSGPYNATTDVLSDYGTSFNDARIEQTLTDLKPSTVYSVGGYVLIRNINGNAAAATTEAVIDITGEETSLATTLRTALTTDATVVETANATDISSFPDSGVLLIEDEKISYAGKDVTNHKFTLCIRGFENTTAAMHANATTVKISPFTHLTTTTSSATNQGKFTLYKNQFATTSTAREVKIHLICKSVTAGDGCRFDGVQVVEGRSVTEFQPSPIVDTGDQTVYGTLRMGRTSDGRGGILAVDKSVRTRAIEFFEKDPGMSGTAGGFGGIGTPAKIAFGSMSSTATLTTGGQYFGANPREVVVTVTQSGANGQFKWEYRECFPGSGCTSALMSGATGLSIADFESLDDTGNPLPGSMGVKVAFANTGTITAGDQWSFHVSGTSTASQYNSYSGTATYQPGETRIYKDPFTGKLTFQDGTKIVTLDQITQVGLAMPAHVDYPMFFPYTGSGGGGSMWLNTTQDYVDNGRGQLTFEVEICADGPGAGFTRDKFQVRDNKNAGNTAWDSSWDVACQEIPASGGPYTMMDANPSTTSFDGSLPNYSFTITFGSPAGTWQDGKVGDRWQFIAYPSSGATTNIRSLTQGGGITVTGTGESRTVAVKDCAANEVLKRNAGDTDWVCAADETGGSSDAPIGATYVTLTTNGSLSGERTLVAGNGLGLTDGGANGSATLDVNVDSSSLELNADTLRVKASGIVSSMIGDGTIVAVDLASDAVTSAKILDGEIVNADIGVAAAIVDTKLATISTAGKVADSALSASVSLLGQTIESGEITNGTIAAADLAPSSVTKVKLAELAPSAQATADKTLAIAAGKVYVSGNALVDLAATSANFASGGNCAYTPVALGKFIKAVVTLTSAGAIACTMGTEQATSGAAQSESVTYPTDKLPIAEVILKTNGTAAGNVATIEATDGGNSYLYADVRPAFNVGAVYTAGNGLQLTGNAFAAKLYGGSGLLSDATGLSLLRTCANNEILKWNNGTGSWACATDAGSAGSTITAQEGGSAVDAAMSTLNFAATDFIATSNPAGTVTLAIDYTNSKVTRTDQAETLTGNWVNTTSPWADNEVSDTLTASLFVGSGSTTTAIDLGTAEVAGTLAVGNGGTGATTAANARISLGLAIGTDVQAYNVATSLLGQTIESSEIANGEIVNADVAAAAAIAGTKISPDFGSQTVTTTGPIGVGADQKLSLEGAPSSSDSYFMFDSANSRIRFFINGFEVARLKQ